MGNSGDGGEVMVTALLRPLGYSKVTVRVAALIRSNLSNCIVGGAI